jgi:hypothetical protein
MRTLHTPIGLSVLYCTFLTPPYSRIAGDVYLTPQTVELILSQYASTAEATAQDVPSNVVRFPYAPSR